jgi:hypothetical protein
MLQNYIYRPSVSKSRYNWRSVVQSILKSNTLDPRPDLLVTVAVLSMWATSITSGLVCHLPKSSTVVHVIYIYNFTCRHSPYPGRCQEPRSLWILQDIHKGMIRFQKLIKNLFLTLHEHNIHCQQRRLFKFLMPTAGPRDQFPRWRRSRRRLSLCSCLRCADLWLQCSASFMHG